VAEDTTENPGPNDWFRAAVERRRRPLPGLFPQPDQPDEADAENPATAR
jgi:hypothetical protein